MNLLLTADWQAHVKNLDRCEQSLEFLVQCIHKYKVGAVGLLGDMKDPFNPVDQRITNWLISMGHRVNNICPVFALKGNHDAIAIADGSETGLPVLAAAGIVTIETPTQLEFGGRKIWCVPFYRDTALAEQYIKRGIKENAILFFHNEVMGCATNLSFKSPTGLDHKLLQHYKLAIGGHIHFQQEAMKNIWFTGSPFCHDWGEANQRKGFLLLDTKTLRVTPIETPLPIWFDPVMQGYVPKSFKGVRVRVRLPHDLKEAEKVQQQAQRNYPDALFQFENKRASTVASIALENASDPELIRQYLTQNQLWPNVGQLGAYLEHKMFDLGTGLRGLRGCQFLEVNGSNVLCFEQVSLPLNRPGITLITGQNKDWGGGRSNGTGKTSLLGLPLILLFGRTAKGQESDRWARQFTKAKAALSGTLKLADGRTLTVTRKRRPGAIEAMLDDKPVGAGDARGVQKAITDYTGLSWEVLMASLYVGQAEASTLLVGTDKERKELFNQFLGLQRFQVAAERISIDLKNTRRAIEEIEQQGFLLIQAIQQKQQWVKRIELDQAAQQEQLKKLDGYKDKLNADEPVHKAGELRAAKIRKDLVISRAAALKAYQEHSTLVERLRNLQVSMTTVEQGKNCPVCGRPLPKTEKSNTAHLKQEHAKTFKHFEVAKKNLQARTDEQNALEMELQKLLIQQQKLNQDIVRNRTIVESITLNSQVENRMAEAQGELDDKLQQAGYVKNYLEDLREQVQFLQAALQVVGRSGLPAFLCTLVCPQLNEAAEEFSNAFAEAGVRVVFSGVEGEVDVRVDNPHGGEETNDQSQGEMRLAALIASFAMRAVLAPYNLLILDEPGDGLDPVNASIFARGLSQVAKRFGTVFIVTHNPAILEALEYNYWIELVKQDRVTTAYERV